MVDLSIIIVNFNTKKLTINCINSVWKHVKKTNFEIIVVDNASTDGSIDALKLLKKRKKIKIIKSYKNIGFGAANNMGMRVAAGKYILLLNSDTLIESSAIDGMVEWMKKNKEVGATSCALKNSDGSTQATGGYFPSLLKVVAWMFLLDDLPVVDRIIKPFHPMHPHSPIYKGVGDFKNPKERDWLTGAFLLIDKKVLEKVGYFDEDYFMYTEEVDLCYRIKKAGWKIWYLPKWSVIHFGGSSSTKEFPIVGEYKGVKTFYKKHMPQWQYPLIRIFLKLGALIRIIIISPFKGRSIVKTYVKAFKVA